MSAAITRVVGKLDYCRTCEKLTEVHETPAGTGPYCRECVDDAADREESGGGR